ncbi:hypothetical protein MMC07_007831 [Pseudocyphellaria aurata]|nr:hypothetical protein [Pseudocyphellaria aurata]
MRIVPLLILLGSFKKSTVASHFDERDFGGFWPDWDIPGAIWGAGVTAVGALGTLLNSQDSNSDSNTKPPPNTDTQSGGQTQPNALKDAPAPLLSPPLSGTSSPVEQVYKLNINNDPPTNAECGSFSVECGKTTDQLIFTSSCVGIDPNQVVSAGAIAQNQAIHDTLVLMNGENILTGTAGPGLRISTLKPCDVFFFAVPLTQQQIKDIEEKPGVESVRPNQPLTEDLPGSSDQEDDPTEIPVLTAPGAQLKERDEVIVEDFGAKADLRFISTPKNSELSSAYSYDEKAGEEATIIAVSSGVDAHSEFVTTAGESSLLEQRILAMDYNRPGDPGGTGTCLISKMIGRTVGVAKKAKVIVAQTFPSLSSLIDVFVQIANYLIVKLQRGEKVKGYHVMSFMLQWQNTDQEIATRFDEILFLLINFLQLVVVVPAGNDYAEQNSDIINWPATTERRHNIIVVGAVEVSTGRTYGFSRGGPFLSVNAPGLGRCADARISDGTSYKLRRGTDVSAAMVTGLISYLLSLDGIGPMLREHPSIIPFVVKDFIMKRASYKRLDDDVPAIWNLLSAST